MHPTESDTSISYIVSYLIPWRSRKNPEWMRGIGILHSMCCRIMGYCCLKLLVCASQISLNMLTLVRRRTGDMQRQLKNDHSPGFWFCLFVSIVFSFVVIFDASFVASFAGLLCIRTLVLTVSVPSFVHGHNGNRLQCWLYKVSRTVNAVCPISCWLIDWC